MGEIINLRQARKAKARSDKAAAADANRVKFGRTKGQKQAEAAAEQKMRSVLDGALRQGRQKEEGEDQG
jgi:hypothetical protein